MGFSYGQSTQWAISAGAVGGLVPLAGISPGAIRLFDVQNQIFFPGLIAGSSIGAGLKGGGAVSTFTPKFFTVATSMYALDFDNSLCGMLDLALVPGIGASVTGLTIYGVHHSPSVLNLSSLSLGFGEGSKPKSADVLMCI